MSGPNWDDLCLFSPADWLPAKVLVASGKPGRVLAAAAAACKTGCRSGTGRNETLLIPLSALSPLATPTSQPPCRPAKPFVSQFWVAGRWKDTGARQWGAAWEKNKRDGVVGKAASRVTKYAGKGGRLIEEEDHRGEECRSGERERFAVLHSFLFTDEFSF